MIQKAGASDDKIGLVLLGYFPQFIEALRSQLERDDTRWGDTWEQRTREGQEKRAQARFSDYFDQFRATGMPVPWLKIAGTAFICWVRELRDEKRGER